MGEYKITANTIKEAHKPFDVVTDRSGNVGFINEVSCNECQPEHSQVSYSVIWMIGHGDKTAWYKHGELDKHCNLFVMIGEGMCHPMGNSKKFVKRFFE